MQHHVLKLKMDMLNIFFNFRVTIAQKLGLKRPTFIFSFLYYGVGSPSVGLTMHFLLTVCV